MYPTSSQAVIYGKRSISSLDLNNELRSLIKILVNNYLIHLDNKSLASNSCSSPIVAPVGYEEVDNYYQVGHFQKPYSNIIIVLLTNCF